MKREGWNCPPLTLRHLKHLNIAADPPPATFQKSILTLHPPLSTLKPQTPSAARDGLRQLRPASTLQPSKGGAANVHRCGEEIGVGGGEAHGAGSDRSDRGGGGHVSPYGMLVLEGACEDILRGVAGAQGLCAPMPQPRLVALKILHGLVTCLSPSEGSVPDCLDCPTAVSPPSVDTAACAPRARPLAPLAASGGSASARVRQYANEILAVCVHALHPCWGGARHLLASQSQDSQDDDDSSAREGWGQADLGSAPMAAGAQQAPPCSAARSRLRGWDVWFDEAGGVGSEAYAACGLGLWSDEGRWHVCETMADLVRVVPLQDVLAVCEQHFLGAGAMDEYNEPLDSPPHR